MSVALASSCPHACCSTPSVNHERLSCPLQSLVRIAGVLCSLVVAPLSLEPTLSHLSVQFTSIYTPVLQGLLNKRPADRLTWPALLDHPFVKESSDERMARERQLAEAAAMAGASRGWRGEAMGGPVAQEGRPPKARMAAGRLDKHGRRHDPDSHDRIDSNPAEGLMHANNDNNKYGTLFWRRGLNAPCTVSHPLIFHQIRP